MIVDKPLTFLLCLSFSSKPNYLDLPTVSGNVTLPEMETGNARGLEIYATRQGQTIRFTGDISMAAGGTGAAGNLYWGPGAPGTANADGRTHGTYRFTDFARSYPNPQTITNGTVVVEGSVGAVGSASPIGTQTFSLGGGNGGNLFSANQNGPIQSS